MSETVYQGYSGPTAVATGKVISFNNNILQLKNINGNFVSNLPINATSSRANYKFTTYNPAPQKMVQIDIRPQPANANVSLTSTWTANTIITEYYSSSIYQAQPLTVFTMDSLITNFSNMIITIDNG